MDGDQAMTDDVNGWQPIETAPKDGTRLLLAGGGSVEIGWWKPRDPKRNPDPAVSGDWHWADSYESGPLTSLTHWQHLPPPPDA